MRSPSRFWPLLGLLLLAAACCVLTRSPDLLGAAVLPTPGQDKGPDKAGFPPLGPAQKLEGGIRFHEVTLQRAGVPMKVWVYLPEKAADKMPCVLVGPAGTHLIDGMKLTKGDQAEHLPYARAGFVVVSFEIDGAWPAEKPSEAEMIAAATAFRKAHAGVDNARSALDYALERVPAIDPERVFVAGHSSAATLALLVAASEPRIKACVAYAPVADVPRRLGPGATKALDAAVPGYADFLKGSSPSSYLADLKCPVFLFQAKDDTNVLPALTRDFAAELKKTNPRVTYVEVDRGGHYQSMVREGIPQAIAWLGKLPK